MAIILIIEDEADIVDVLRYNLQREQWTIHSSGMAADGLKLIEHGDIDLVILDLMLPGGMDGLELCRRLRSTKAYRRLPILMLTARGEEFDRVLGLELGADDYLSKPFSPREVVARCKALLRRAYPAPDEDELPLVVGPLQVYVSRYEAHLDGQPMELTAREFDLLVFMVRHRGRLLPREILLAEVWDLHGGIDSRTVDVHIRRLRAKLGIYAEWLRTLRGAGYKFVGPPERPSEPENQ